MMLLIPLNGSLSVRLRIVAVGYWENTKAIALSVGCQTPEEAELIKALNIAGDELACEDVAAGGEIE